jgi:hypothetical protein
MSGRRRNIRTQLDAELAAEQEAAAQASQQQPKAEAERAAESPAPAIQTEPSNAPEREAAQPAPFSPASAAAQAEPSQEEARPKRVKIGWPVRADLVKQCKQIALDEGRHDYEILEELLEAGLLHRPLAQAQQ